MILHDRMIGSGNLLATLADPDAIKDVFVGWIHEKVPREDWPSFQIFLGEQGINFLDYMGNPRGLVDDLDNLYFNFLQAKPPVETRARNPSMQRGQYDLEDEEEEV